MSVLVKYIGVPFVNLGRDINTGVDCWGLVCAFYDQEMGITLRQMQDGYDSGKDWDGMANTVHNESLNWQKVETPQYGDVIIFNVRGRPSHVGIYIDEIKFIHAIHGIDSCSEKLNGLMWKNRIHGYYRHHG